MDRVRRMAMRKSWSNSGSSCRRTPSSNAVRIASWCSSTERDGECAWTSGIEHGDRRLDLRTRFGAGRADGDDHGIIGRSQIGLAVEGDA